MDRTIRTARTSGPREFPRGGHVGAAYHHHANILVRPPKPFAYLLLNQPPNARLLKTPAPNPTPIPAPKVLRFVSWAVAGIGLAVMNLLVEMVS